MEKLTSKSKGPSGPPFDRFYCDYNATSPLSDSVLELLGSGEIPFGNPSSLHRTGKKANKALREARDFLFETFQVKPKDFNLVFHSGASEGINSFIKGAGMRFFEEKESLTFFMGPGDHNAVVKCEPLLKLLGHKVEYFKVNEVGDLDLRHLKERLSQTIGPKALNFLQVNNESGVVWPLDYLNELSNIENLYIHVDGVQAPGKIEDWNRLDKVGNLDKKKICFTYSGHKFGALKGVGFSFVSQNLGLPPLVEGGGQQKGLRSGTENITGIISLHLALKDLLNHYNFSRSQKGTRWLEEQLKQTYKDKVIIAGEGGRRNSNTIYLLIPGKKSTELQMALDLNSIDVGVGSACSSGTQLPSRVLTSMGHDHDEAISALRFSFGTDFCMEKAQKLWVPLESTFSKILI